MDSEKKNYPDYYPFDCGSDERRKSDRRVFNAGCKLRIRSLNDTISGQMHDISAEGMQVSVADEIAICPFYVAIELSLTESRTMIFEGYVDSAPDQRNGEYIYRIKLFNLTDEQQAFVHDLIGQLPKPSDRRDKRRLRNAVDVNNVEYRHIQHKSRLLSPRDRRKSERRRINQPGITGERRVKDRRERNRRAMEEKIQYADWTIKPTLRDSVEKLLQFYKVTDFIYKKKLDFLLPVKNEVLDTIGKMLRCNTDTCRYFFVMDGDEIQGSTMAVQYTDDTWVVQHTATLPNQKLLAKQLLAEVLGWVIRNDDANYFMTYFREKTRFASNKFGSFVDAMQSQYAVIETHEYVCKVLSANDGAHCPVGGVNVDYLKYEDYSHVYALLSRDEKKGFLHSVGLKEQLSDFANVKEKYEKIGLKRDRKYLVAKKEGKIVGFAFIDISSYGINLSLLFNTFSVFVFEDHNRETVFRAMVARINQILLEHGKYYSIGLARSSDKSIFEQLGYQHHRTYVRFICSREEDLFNKANHVLLQGRKNSEIARE